MYVLMGANGNITSKAAQILLRQGHKVRVIGRSAANLESLRQAGAEVVTADARDATALTRAFAGATAVYTMIPPNYTSPTFRAWQDSIGTATAAAISASGVKRVVHLSSIGAHLPAGTGPIAGLHAQEARLDAIPGLDLLHVRAGYFYENHLNALGTIAGMGVYADMIDGTVPVASVATADIAGVVARELVRGQGAGSRVVHLHGDRLTQQEAAAILGNAIGRPGLKHVQANPAQAKAGMVAHGLSADMANLFEEMSNAIGRADFFPADLAGGREVAPTRLADWASGAFKGASEAMAKVA